MRFLILAAVAGAVALPTAANAQYYGGRGYGYGQGYGYGYNNRVQRERRECERELRHARNRWEYQRELRECRREINEARHGDRHRGYRDDYGYGRGDRRYRDDRWRNRY
jgi:hypothetical protein